MISDGWHVVPGAAGGWVPVPRREGDEEVHLREDPLLQEDRQEPLQPAQNVSPRTLTPIYLAFFFPPPKKNLAYKGVGVVDFIFTIKHLDTRIV